MMKTRAALGLGIFLMLSVITVGLSGARSQAAHAAARPMAAPPAVLTLKLSVTQEGVYRLTQSYLSTNHFDMARLNVKKLGLSDSGVTVPLYVHQSVAGTKLGSSDYVEFYGHPVNNTYTFTNVYVLTDDGSHVARVATDQTGVAKSPRAVADGSYIDEHRTDRDLDTAGDPAYSTSVSWPTAGDYQWKETDLQVAAQSPTKYAVPFDIASPSSAGTCTVTVPVIAYADEASTSTPGYDLGIAINGHRVTAPTGNPMFTWNGQVGDNGTKYTAVGAFPCADLSATNTLTFSSGLQPMVQFAEVLPQSFHIAYAERLCAGKGRLQLRAGKGSYSVAGFTGGSVEIWRIDAGATSRLAGATVSHTGAGVCGGPSYSAVFRDKPSGKARYFAFTKPLTPRSATPPDLSDVTGGTNSSARYLIITPAVFESGVVPLAAYHRHQGMTVKVVTLDGIYDQYHRKTGQFVPSTGTAQPGDGLVDPEAIRAYITYAHAHLGTRYVLLVGGDTFDYHNTLGCPRSGQCKSGNPDNRSFMPSLYAMSIFAGLVPTDNLYATPVGSKTIAPDVAIGRLPVLSQAQLGLEVSKTVGFSSGLSTYARTATFAAGFPTAAGYAPECAEPSFVTASRRMAGLLPSGFKTTTAFEDGRTADDQVNRATLLSGWNAGREIINYIGHGNLVEWSCLPMLRSADASGLTNYNKPALVFQWGCQAADYVEPRSVDIDAALLNAAGAKGPTGAVLTLGSTGQDAIYEQELLAGGSTETGPGGSHYFFGYLGAGDSVGVALEKAKDAMIARHGTEPLFTDVVASYTILGDPALKI